MERSPCLTYTTWNYDNSISRTPHSIIMQAKIVVALSALEKATGNDYV